MARTGRVCLLAGIGALMATGFPAFAPSASAQDTAPAGKPFQEYAESFKDWRLYCQVWSTPRRIECELGSRPGSDKSSRVVWLRSSERWMDGLRLRLDEGGTDVSKGVRVWVDNGLFRPEFPCKPSPFESNTCAVTDPETNRKLVEKLATGKDVSAVGVSPTGAKSEVRFSLNGFKTAVDRMEQLRREAGTPWM